MSVAPSEPQHPDTPTPYPDTTPCLPVIQIGADDPRLRVHLSHSAARQAAGAAPEAAFYDARGIRLQPVGDAPALQALGSADPAALRELVLGELRGIVETSGLGGAETADVTAIVDWLAAAPAIEPLLLALAFVEPDDEGELEVGVLVGDKEEPPIGRHCTACTGWQRVRGQPGCC